MLIKNFLVGRERKQLSRISRVLLAINYLGLSAGKNPISADLLADFEFQPSREFFNRNITERRLKNSERGFKSNKQLELIILDLINA